MVTPFAARQSESGLVAVSTALVLAALLGFFALAFNIGVLMETRAQLQNGADAAALAAARSLNGQASGLDAARLAAIDYSSRHAAFGENIEIGSTDVTFGRWHLLGTECQFGSSGHDCFEPLSVTDPRKISAVKIGNGRDGVSTHNSLVALPFGAFVGASTGSVSSRAVAVGGGAGAVSCPLPLVVAECKIVNSLNNQMTCGPNPQMTATFSNAPGDSVGFVNMDPSNKGGTSGAETAAAIKSLATCDSSSVRETGSYPMQNGNDFGKVIDALRGATINGKKETINGPCLIGVTQTLAVSEAGCPNPIFQGSQQVVGFVKAIIVAVTDNQGTLLACPNQTLPVVPLPLQKNSVILAFPCEAPASTSDWGGGRAYNESNVRLRLVQ